LAPGCGGDPCLHRKNVEIGHVKGKHQPMLKKDFELIPAPPAYKYGWPWVVDYSAKPEYMPDGREWPRISVTVPSLNQGQFIEETLRSLVMQDYPDLEIFVMDGGSTDHSLEILKKYNKFISHWESQFDDGQSHAINKGWRLSRGELIAYINSDDIYMPDALRKAALKWNYENEISMVCGGIAFLNQEGMQIKTQFPRLAKAAPLDLSLLDISEWYLPQQACFFNRRQLDIVGRWLRGDLHYVMDRELLYRLCRVGKIKLLDEVLAADRQHPAAKRQKDRLKLYREDTIAMEYCNWGSPLDYKRRIWVANQRMAQGYRMSAEDEKNLAMRLILYTKAVMIRPSYLKGLPWLKNFLVKVKHFYRQITDHQKEVAG